MENLSLNDRKLVPFFECFSKGKFLPHNVELRIVRNKLKRSPESEGWIQEEWLRKVKNGLKVRPNDTKPSRYHFVASQIHGNKLIVFVDPTLSYRDVIGSRPQEFRKRFGGDFLPMPLSVSMAIFAKNRLQEEQVMITLRSELSDFKGGGYHVSVGGAIDSTTGENPLEAALREVREETGLLNREITNTMCYGVNREEQIPDIGILFFGDATISAEEVVERLHDDENEVLLVSLDHLLGQWLLKTTYATTGDTIAALLLVGKERYGNVWFESIKDALIEKGALLENREATRLAEREDIEQFQNIIRAYRHKKI